MATYTPLTREQYQKALDAGFTPDQIITNEKQRKAGFAAAPSGVWGGIKNFFTRPLPKLTTGGPTLDIVAGSEMGLGTDIGKVAGPKSYTIEQAVQSGKSQEQLISEAKSLPLGDRRTQLLQAANQMAQVGGGQAGEALANLPTAGKVGWEIAGTAADVFGAGTYTEEGLIGEKALTSGLQKGTPAVIKAGGKALDVAGNAIEGGKQIVGKVATKVGKVAEKGLIGKEGMKTLEQIGDTEAQKFAKGKTFSSTVKAIQEAIGSFVDTSKKALQVVKDKIPKISIEPEKVATKVNEAIMKSIKGAAEYKGVGEEAVNLFKTPEDLINSGLLSTEESKTVNGMVKSISSWSDNSARGILNLKEQLSTFYKEGYGGSNRILSNIQKGLKDLVGEVAPDIKPALESASKNIDKATEFTRNLIGKDAVSGESKLISIAKNLKNPAVGGEKLKLLQELKAFTGHDALPELKGYANYLELLAKNFPTKAGTILKQIAKTAAGITVGGGILGGVYEGIKKLLP